MTTKKKKTSKPRAGKPTAKAATRSVPSSARRTRLSAPGVSALPSTVTGASDASVGRERGGGDQYRPTAELYAVLADDLRDWQAQRKRGPPIVRELHQTVITAWKAEVRDGFTAKQRAELADEINEFLAAPAQRAPMEAVQRARGWPVQGFRVTPEWAEAMAQLMLRSPNKPLAPYAVTLELW